ncbi:malonyl-CoA decarboxylase [Hoeflea sp. YIM 152468]|nr:malonyl-CoA decarboxylase [Hoeflea sp. YIM 152468]MDF1608820.1 malonyl-CoA decarboxylase [Hoeflea sp. YIM 152468]
MSSLIRSRLQSIADKGLSIIGLSTQPGRKHSPKEIVSLCHLLLSGRGEASGAAVSREILNCYQALSETEKTDFFHLLLSEFSVEPEKALEAANDYVSDPGHESLDRLLTISQPPRLNLIMRLNQAPNATKFLVEMRADLLVRLRKEPDLRYVDRDFVHLFTAWFSRGFLDLKSIDWNTPAAILEKIIHYEAVHGMAGWEDLRKRINPEDRRIFAFFHPRLGDEPLIFVEVALMNDVPASIQTVLGDAHSHNPALESSRASTAIFYSISNCQRGLRGIPLGNFLIKQVVEELRAEYPGLKSFVTLSPAPSFRQWVTDALEGKSQVRLPRTTIKALKLTQTEGWQDDAKTAAVVQAQLMPLAAWFFCNSSANRHRVDPVARFHLGNGARLDRLNWAADLSKKGMAGSFGIMVNYRYQLDAIERNHEMFANNGVVVASPAVIKAAKTYGSILARQKPVEASLRGESSSIESAGMP